MKAMLIKTKTGMAGATPEDQRAWEKFKKRLDRTKPGRYVSLEWSSPRSGKHHRKLFALIALIVENSEIYDTMERALIAIKLAAGYFDLHVDPVTGSLEKIPRSISFESMEQDVFNKFYEDAIHGVVTAVLPQLDRGECDQLLEKIISGWASKVPDYGDMVNYQ